MNSTAESATIRPIAHPLPTGPQKRPFVQQLFTQIAPRYDWFNRLASGGLDQRWRAETLRRGQIGPGQQVLDLCAGTGDLALLCARRQQGTGTVIGLDMNRPMLLLARHKQRVGRLAIHWVEGDAEQLPFADESLDRVVIGFSTRNLTDLTRGLRDMMRVLRPQGRLVILETGYPSAPLVRFAYQAFLLTIARAIGLALTGRLWPFTYLARSVQQFLSPPEFIQRLQTAGAEVEYRPLSWGLASLYIATKRAASTTT